MEWFLMHKNLPVALLKLDAAGNIMDIKRNSNSIKHLPLGCQVDNKKFIQWWKDRAVPKSRKGANGALRALGFPTTNSMLVNNLALSLNDCYWIKPSKSNVTWEQVSLYRNPFIDIFGELTFDTTKRLDMRNKTMFKCASSQGELQKKWCIDSSGKRFLVKGNWGRSYQQSLNEILASEIHKMQNKFPYTPYYLTKVDVENKETGIGCYSYNFCNEQVEFISAWEVLQSERVGSNDSYYLKFCDICEKKLGLNRQYVEDFLSYQIMTDYIITNTDRHMNNIGVLRNPDTLQYYGLAPIYDSGNSMFFRSTKMPFDVNHVETCSFVRKEPKLLKLVKNKGLVDTSKLPSDNYLWQLYSKDIPETQSRIESLIAAYKTKIKRLEQFQNS